MWSQNNVGDNLEILNDSKKSKSNKKCSTKKNKSFTKIAIIVEYFFFYTKIGWKIGLLLDILEMDILFLYINT